MSNGDFYPARLTIDRPSEFNRLTALFRIVLAIPILFLFFLVGVPSGTYVDNGHDAGLAGIGIFGALSIATALMILVRQRYPRWWFDFFLEFSRFGGRVFTYIFLMTDLYPSTEDEQSYHLELDYPNAQEDLNRWMPLFKWALAIPHYIVLAFLSVGLIIAVFLAWLSILFTGNYPKPLFDYVEGVMRWFARVSAYAFMMLTDRYPPFSLK